MSTQEVNSQYLEAALMNFLANVHNQVAYNANFIKLVVKFATDPAIQAQSWTSKKRQQLEGVLDSIVHQRVAPLVEAAGDGEFIEDQWQSLVDRLKSMPLGDFQQPNNFASERLGQYHFVKTGSQCQQQLNQRLTECMASLHL